MTARLAASSAPAPRPDAPSRRPPAAAVERPTVLLLGAYRQALAVARSLNAAGLRVVLGRHTGRSSPLERSRAIADVWIHPPVGSPQRFAQALEALCRSDAAPDYLFPLGDDELALVGALAPLGLPGTVVAAAPDVIERCQQKAQLLDVVQRLGVATMQCERVDSAAAAREAAGRLGFPLVIKAHASGALHEAASVAVIGGKARFVACDADLQHWLRQQPFPSNGVLLQRQAQGTRHNLYFAAWRGELRAIAQTLALRTDRPDGTGLAVEGVGVAPMSTLVSQTQALIKELAYTGVGCAQFLVDAEGRTCFLEINARLGANCSVVTASGLDLPRLFVALMHGDIARQPAAAIGRRFAWLGGDLDGLLDCRRHRSLGAVASLQWLWRAVRAQLKADDHVTFSWRDPWPAVALLTRRFVIRPNAGLNPSAR